MDVKRGSLRSELRTFRVQSLQRASALKLSSVCEVRCEVQTTFRRRLSTIICRNPPKSAGKHVLTVEDTYWAGNYGGGNNSRGYWLPQTKFAIK